METDHIDIRRNTEGSLHQTVSNDLIIRRNPLKKQSDFKKKIRHSKAEYTFLQFHHVIWKWATINNNLTPREISILLYMYPLITFTTLEFNQALVELSSTDAGTLSKFKKEGWVNIWSKSNKTTNYVLSNKANTLVSRMHKMFMSEEEIPLSPRRNKIARKKSKGDEELMGLFKKFNSIVKEKQEKNDRKKDLPNRKKRL